MGNDWPEEILDLGQYQLIYILNSATQVHHNVQIVVDQEVGGNK